MKGSISPVHTHICRHLVTHGLRVLWPLLDVDQKVTSIVWHVGLSRGYVISPQCCTRTNKEEKSARTQEKPGRKSLLDLRGNIPSLSLYAMSWKYVTRSSPGGNYTMVRIQEGNILAAACHRSLHLMRITSWILFTLQSALLLKFLLPTSY